MRCGIRLTSFDLLGEWHHWYCEAWWQCCEDVTAVPATKRIEFALDADEADQLTKEDSLGDVDSRIHQFAWKRGDTSVRFPTKAKAAATGAAFLREKFGADVRIEVGAHYYEENDLYKDPK